MHIIDEACKLLQQNAMKDDDCYAIELYVRRDGRVQITRYRSRETSDHDQADVLPGSALPLPSEVFE